MRLRLPGRPTELPVLPPEVARHAALLDASNGLLEAQARTRAALDAGAAAWVALLASPREAHVERTLTLVDREGRAREATVTVYVPASLES